MLCNRVLFYYITTSSGEQTLNRLEFDLLERGIHVALTRLILTLSATPSSMTTSLWRKYIFKNMFMLHDSMMFHVLMFTIQRPDRGWWKLFASWWTGSPCVTLWISVIAQAWNHCPRRAVLNDNATRLGLVASDHGHGRHRGEGWRGGTIPDGLLGIQNR